MKEIIFAITDKKGRNIYLPKKSWTHITTSHLEMTNYLKEIEETLVNPLKITLHPTKADLFFYYTYQKHRKNPEKYLRLIVKYLNNSGFIITAQFVKYVK